MDQPQAHQSDQVTVLVFKDNYSARTFQVPLKWVSRFGILVSGIIVFGMISILIAAKYYRISRLANPIRVHDLEQEIADLKGHIKTLEHMPLQSLAPHPVATSAAAPLPHPTFLPAESKVSTIAPNPVIPEKMAEPTPGNIFYTAFPPGMQTEPVPSEELPFSVQTPKISWQGKSLHIRFALQYIREDQGSQQGKVMILARGPNTLLGYPSQVFAPVGSDFLIDPQKGEFFSVSRFREVKAEFGPVSAKGQLKTVEIYIFNRDGRLLKYQRIPLNTPPIEEPQPAPVSPEEAAQQ